VATSAFEIIESMLPATLTAPGLSEREFLELCEKFPDATLEYEADGTVLIMPPTDPKTGVRSNRIAFKLTSWAERTGGLVVGPDTGFFLPGGSRRLPDAAWFNESRWNAAQTPGTKFPPFAPDFVIELRSPTDRLSQLARKMREYVDNGVQLAWLIDPQNRTVSIYRPGAEPALLVDPTEVRGEGPVEGFVLPLTEIF
jgi:Uma2 family endonuclease